MAFLQVLPSGGASPPAIARESEHQPTRLFAWHHAVTQAMLEYSVDPTFRVLICDCRKEINLRCKKSKPSMSQMGQKCGLEGDRPLPVYPRQFQSGGGLRIRAKKRICASSITPSARSSSDDGTFIRPRICSVHASVEIEFPNRLSHTVSASEHTLRCGRSLD